MSDSKILKDRTPVQSHTVTVKPGNIKDVERSARNGRRFLTGLYISWCLLLTTLWALWGRAGLAVRSPSDDADEAFFSLWIGFGMIFLMLIGVSFVACLKNRVFDTNIKYTPHTYHINDIKAILGHPVGTKIGTFVWAENAGNETVFVFEGNIDFDSDVICVHHMAQGNDNVYVYCLGEQNK